MSDTKGNNHTRQVVNMINKGLDTCHAGDAATAQAIMLAAIGSALLLLHEDLMRLERDGIRIRNPLTVWNGRDI